MGERIRNIARRVRNRVAGALGGSRRAGGRQVMRRSGLAGTYRRVSSGGSGGTGH